MVVHFNSRSGLPREGVKMAGDEAWRGLRLRTGRDSYWGAGKRVLGTQQLDPTARSATLSAPIQSLKNHASPTPGLQSQGGSFHICSHEGQVGREDEKRDEQYVEGKLEQLPSPEEHLPPAAQPTGQCCVGGICGKNSHAGIWMTTQMDCRATQDGQVNSVNTGSAAWVWVLAPLLTGCVPWKTLFVLQLPT